MPPGRPQGRHRPAISGGTYSSVVNLPTSHFDLRVRLAGLMARDSRLTVVSTAHLPRFGAALSAWSEAPFVSRPLAGNSLVSNRRLVRSGRCRTAFFLPCPLDNCYLGQIGSLPVQFGYSPLNRFGDICL